MTVGLVIGQDLAVAQWTFQKYNLHPMPVSGAYGLVRDGQLEGSFFFSGWNRYNIEVSYFGVDTLTAGVVRFIARVCLERFNVQRLTFHTKRTNKKLIKFYTRLGAQREGMMKRFYGETDAWEHTAVQFALFRDALEKLAHGGKTIH